VSRSMELTPQARNFGRKSSLRYLYSPVGLGISNNPDSSQCYHHTSLLREQKPPNPNAGPFQGKNKHKTPVTPVLVPFKGKTSTNPNAGPFQGKNEHKPQ
jgi:hypothetical protein